MACGDSPFGDHTIDWDLIQRHWQDLLRTGISIREGRLSSVTLLRRLGRGSGSNRGGMTVRAIASLIDLSPARIGQILAEADHGPLLDQLRELRSRWNVDADPATRAAADQIIAHVTAWELGTASNP